MIPYEELDKALSRWKARRSSAAAEAEVVEQAEEEHAVEAEAVVEAVGVVATGDDELDADAMAVEGTPLPVDPELIGSAEPDYSGPTRSGEDD